MVRRPVSGEHVEPDVVLPQVFSNIRVALDVGIVQHRSVIARRGFIDPPGQRPEAWDRVDGHHVLGPAFPEHRADARGHGGLADAALSRNHADDILLANVPAYPLLQLSVMSFSGRFTQIDGLE